MKKKNLSKEKCLSTIYNIACYMLRTKTTYCSRFWAICSIRCNFGLVTKIMFCTLLGGSPLSDRGNIFSTSCSCWKITKEKFTCDGGLTVPFCHTILENNTSTVYNNNQPALGGLWANLVTQVHVTVLNWVLVSLSKFS